MCRTTGRSPRLICPLARSMCCSAPTAPGNRRILDTIWFVRDCAIRSVAAASNGRDHGIGLLYDGAPEGSPIVVALATEEVRYELTLEFSAGRIEPMAGERLGVHRSRQDAHSSPSGDGSGRLFQRGDGAIRQFRAPRAREAKPESLP